MIVGKEDSTIIISGIFLKDHDNKYSHENNQDSISVKSVSDIFYTVTISTDFGRVLLAECSSRILFLEGISKIYNSLISFRGTEILIFYNHSHHCYLRSLSFLFCLFCLFLIIIYGIQNIPILFFGDLNNFGKCFT